VLPVIGNRATNRANDPARHGLTRHDT